VSDFGVGSPQHLPTFQELIEASSLGTPEAKAARARVPLEEARAVVERAAGMSENRTSPPGDQP
jgi:hypothetical protein